MSLPFSSSPFSLSRLISPLWARRIRIVSRLRAAGCVYAEDEADLLIAAATTPGQLWTLVDRRIAGFPLEHLLGWAHFHGLRVVVAPGVFVPRTRTALLVRTAVARVDQSSTVVDLCCGSGAIGTAIATSVPGIRLYAADVDPVAVGCARQNLRPFGAEVLQGDLCAPLPDHLRGRVDLMVANVPYVPTDELGLLPAEARLHEPRQALDGGPDGLDVLRRVAAEAPAWLARGGHVLLETGERQAPAAVDILDRAGLDGSVTYAEDLDATVVIGARR